MSAQIDLPQLREAVCEFASLRSVPKPAQNIPLRDPRWEAPPADPRTHSPAVGCFERRSVKCEHPQLAKDWPYLPTFIRGDT